MSDGGDNGQEVKQEKKEFFIRISIIGTQIKYETNVTGTVMGYGLCEWGKKAVDAHMMQLAQEKKPLIQPVKGAFGGPSGNKRF